LTEFDQHEVTSPHMASFDPSRLRALLGLSEDSGESADADPR
jgi:hypothetical protein